MAFDGIEASFLPICSKNLKHFSLQQVFDFIVTKQWERLGKTKLGRLPTAFVHSDWHCAVGELVMDFEDEMAVQHVLTSRSPMGRMLYSLLGIHDDSSGNAAHARARWPRRWRELAVQTGLNTRVLDVLFREPMPAIYSGVVEKGDPIVPTVTPTSTGEVLWSGDCGRSFYSNTITNTAAITTVLTEELTC